MAKKPTYEELEQRVKDLEKGATELIQAEEQATRLRALFDDIIDLNPYSVQICDREGHHVRGNRAYIELFKAAPPPEYSIFNDLNLQKAGLQELVNKVKDGETVHLPEIWYNPHDIKPEYPDKLVCMHVVFFALPAPDGEIDGVVLMHEDITERKQAEEKLASSEEFLNSVIEQNPSSLWISDSEGTLLKMNPACRELFGATDEKAVGKYNILKDNLIEEQGFMPLVENVFERGEIARFTIDYDLPSVEQVKVKGATHKILDVIVSPIKDMHGKVTNAIVQHNDITELKRAEEALKEYSERLEQMVEERTDKLRVMVNAMAGRETRMAELKKTILKLRDQLESAGLSPVADDPLKVVGKEST